MTKTIRGGGGAAPYQKGYRGERIVRESLRERGWLVLKVYASKAPSIKDGETAGFDLLAMAPLPEGYTGSPRVYLIEVKNGPSAAMGPEARERLIEVAHLYGAIAVKAHYSRKVPGDTEWTNLATGRRMADPALWG